MPLALSRDPGPTPSVGHVTGDMKRRESIFPGLPRFSRSSASVYYTERKPKNKKRGRPGNETRDKVREKH